MSEKGGAHHVVDLLLGHPMVINMLNLASPRHHMVGLLEVDVTIAGSSLPGTRRLIMKQFPSPAS